MRILLVTILAAITLAAISTSAAAQDPGMPTDTRVELREGPGGQVRVVVRWSPSVNPDADYQVWRRTPWDISFQVAEPYADVPRSARLADGTFEFVDPTPFAIRERPCYMVSATLGGPPQSHALPGCIPTLPAAMPGLALTALPGPYPNSWYITGTGFARGAYIQLQELTCPSVPCPGQGLSIPTGRIEAAIDGRFSVFTALPAGGSEGTRRIVAYERGWLPSQYAVAPGVDVPATHSGAVTGYPASIRTGEPAIDQVLDALASGDADQVASLLQIRQLPALSDGQPIDALPAITCGNGDHLATGFTSLFREFFSPRVYAVFRIEPVAGQWRAFERATHAIVLASANEGYAPLGSVLTVDGSGIVGVGQPCGAPPTYYLRDIESFVLAPLTTPAPPATGSGSDTGAPADHSSVSLEASGLLLLALAAVLSLAWAVRGHQHQKAGDKP